jgi:hypothetical protein
MVSKRVLNEYANRRTDHCTHDHVLSAAATRVPATIRTSQIAKNAAEDAANRCAGDSGAPGVVSISTHLLMRTETVRSKDSWC